ncbi:hypothetical protein N7528_000828 [Penicillium herquei]|nr:hypothetical protein N7528_000828 [Penicillium herquei]
MSGSSWSRDIQLLSDKAGFLTLPAELRDNILRRLLILPQPLYVFQDGRGPVEVFATEKPYTWLTLTRVNRQTSLDARRVIYGAHKFMLEAIETPKTSGDLVRSFLNSIGPVNASFVCHLAINFPLLETSEKGLETIGLSEGSTQMLKLLQTQCTNLKTLELLVFEQASSKLLEETEINTSSVQEIFIEINAFLRDIPSLNRIRVKASNGLPSHIAKEFLENLGWEIHL